MFVILHRVFFRNFFSNIKNAPLPPGRAVLLRACSCVPPSPPASGDSHSTDSGAYLQAGRAGGRAAGALPGRGGADLRDYIHWGSPSHDTHHLSTKQQPVGFFFFFFFLQRPSY